MTRYIARTETPSSVRDDAKREDSHKAQRDITLASQNGDRHTHPVLQKHLGTPTPKTTQDI